MATVRAFIAIELEPAILRALAEMQDQVREQVPPKLVRWTRPEGIHLTLKFLGDVPAEQVEAIAREIAKAGHANVDVTDEGAVLYDFPSLRV